MLKTGQGEGVNCRRGGTFDIHAAKRGSEPRVGTLGKSPPSPCPLNRARLGDLAISVVGVSVKIQSYICCC